MVHGGHSIALYLVTHNNGQCMVSHNIIMVTIMTHGPDMGILNAWLPILISLYPWSLTQEAWTLVTIQGPCNTTVTSCVGDEVL